MYEVWTPLQRIDEIVDISPYVKTKRAAIRAYKCQCDVLAFDEAILGLNRYRGEMHSWPGGDYAEIFCRLRA
jgi:LmbE family N-acetylglucosaminyl deacetylase